jgi:acetolactate synthase-1/2/3 large subunit
MTASGRSLAVELVTALRSAGTALVFGVPGGGSNLDLVGAAEEAGARFVLAHGETAAAIMAGVAGELTGAPGACVVTRGPGAASAVNGVAQALLDRQPMVLITDCVSEADEARVSHQRLDQRALFTPVTKASLRYGPNTGGLATAAVAMTQDGRPGPVHLDVDPTATGSVELTATTVDGRPLHGDVDAARAAIRTAHRPVVVAGVGLVAVAAARRDAVRSSLHRFLDGTNVPVLTTYKARGVIADDGPNAAGVATGATIEAPVLDAADLVIGVGLDPVELIPAPWPYAAPVVLLGGWPIDDNTFFGDRAVAEVTGELGVVLDVVLDTMARAVTTSWTTAGAAAFRALALDRLRAAVPRSPIGLNPHDVVAVAREEAPAGSVATVDAGAHMLVAVPLWEVSQPNELLVSSGLATMGFSLPAAIAAALVSPERRVVCFTGDGGLGMVLAELETLARLELNVVVVVFNDATLSLIAIKQADGQGDERAIGYRATDFAAIASGSGVRAERIADVAHYRAALRHAFEQPGPTLLDVQVDPSAYPAVLDAIRGRRP